MTGLPSQPRLCSAIQVVFGPVRKGATALTLGLLLVVGCAEPTPPSQSPALAGAAGATADNDGCPAQAVAPSRLPGVRPEHETLDYWLKRSPNVDDVLLSAAEIARHNQALTAYAATHPEARDMGRTDLLAPTDRDALAAELTERLSYLHERVADGRYRDMDGKVLATDQQALFSPPSRLPALHEQWRVVLRDTPLRCGPRLQPLLKAPQLDRDFDRNACSTLRTQELVRVLAEWPNDTLLVRSDYSIGWLPPDAPLSGALSEEDARRFASSDKLRALQTLSVGGQTVPAGVLLARAGQRRALVASADGVATSEVLDEAQATATRRPLTRRAVLQAAFAYLGSGYGWGGKDGGRDCSRLLMDVFATLGLRLPRFSAAQSRAGSMSIDISAIDDMAQRLSIIDAAQRQGVVLLHFPGHIMLYLGRNDEGRPMALHAFAEYLTPCASGVGFDGKSETLQRVDKVQISDLSLGRGSSRRSFAERITRVTMLAPAAGAGLASLVQRRPAAPVSMEGACTSPKDVGILVVPRHPHPGEPVRVMVSSSRELGSVNWGWVDGGGRRRELVLKRSGGPPFGYWAELASPTPGKWQARLGDGARVAACIDFVVHDKAPLRQAGAGAVWIPRRRWSRATENLFSMFVARLFDYPLDDRTWPKLQVLLSDSDHNLLYNHLGQDEEERIVLRPDCADLPYFLRSYFAWKLRLPFAYRHCNRGSQGKAPYCDRDIHSNLAKRESSGETSAYAQFASRNIADGVHSGSGRTAPDDDNSDYYPIPLTRESIVAGTMFADPYGHLFVIAGWIPQGLNSYGVLVGADAQPDGTVGRRRFWRGSFLFTPDTSEAGAGFKAFRPAIYRGGSIGQLKNRDLVAASGFTPYSTQQYDGSVDQFYDRVEGLINPRPLKAGAMQEVLITALFEQVKRRVVSVNNGEAYKRTHRGAIKMPRGHAIFETTGAWENFSTPSRDMRLLIAMDTVMSFVDTVKRQPQRFGLSTSQLDAALAALVAARQKSLADKTLVYTRSDGVAQQLRLTDVVARARQFEMAYNPNDCVEIRWAAPAHSDEMKSCRQHAPAHQQRRMRAYRNWFSERKRPAR